MAQHLVLPLGTAMHAELSLPRNCWTDQDVGRKALSSFEAVDWSYRTLSEGNLTFIVWEVQERPRDEKDRRSWSFYVKAVVCFKHR